MGLLRFSQFSQIPDLFKKIQFRTRKTEEADISKAPLTKTEFIYSNGDLLGRNIGVINGTATIRTIADNEILYVIAIVLSWKTSGAAVTGTVSMLAADQTWVVLEVPALNDEHGEIAINLAVPFRMIAGETITVNSSNTSITARGSFMSYQITPEQEKLFKF